MQIMLLCFATIVLSLVLRCHAMTESNTYFLIYDGLVSKDIVASYTGEGGGHSVVPYVMVTDLSTEIATDIIQTYSTTRILSTESAVNAEDRKLEMDRRCYPSILRGGRCTIDHLRVDEVIIQISLQFDEGPDQSTIIKIEVSLSSPNPNLARDVLVRSIPIVNKRINCNEGVIWSIQERRSPVYVKHNEEPSEMGEFQTKMDIHKSSVEAMILERPDLNSRMRIASAHLYEHGKHALEVWSYRTPESKHPVRALFINGALQSTTHFAGKAHAEAIVHPVMNNIKIYEGDASDFRYPERVAILSREPTAVVREVLKHKNIKSVVLLGTDHDAVELTTKYLSINNNCSFLTRTITSCLSQPEVEFVTSEVEPWLDQMLLGGSTVSLFDSLFVDVPVDSDDWLDVEFQMKLMRILHTESAAVVASGSAPLFSDRYNDNYKLNGRDMLLRETNRFQESFLQVYVFDEPHAFPLRSSFIAIFPGDSRSLEHFLRTNVPAIELEIVNRMHAVVGGSPTLLYDGPTHASYQTPSRAWQNWFCNSPMGNSMYMCSTFFTDWYNPSKHYYKTEVRKHEVKGRSLYALEAAPAGTFILPDDTASQLRIDSNLWVTLNEFVEMFPGAGMYEQLRDFILAYGFESEPLGLTGWGVSLANNATFTNHACTEEEENVDYVRDVYVNEFGGEINFSPAIVRYGALVGALAVASRDIEAGEELQIDYAHFRTYTNDDLEDLLANMCNSGDGLVALSTTNEKQDEL